MWIRTYSEIFKSALVHLYLTTIQNTKIHLKKRIILLTYEVPLKQAWPKYDQITVKSRLVHVNKVKSAEIAEIALALSKVTLKFKIVVLVFKIFKDFFYSITFY